MKYFDDIERLPQIQKAAEDRAIWFAGNAFSGREGMTVGAGDLAIAADAFIVASFLREIIKRRTALAAGARRAETNEDLAQSEGRQGGPKGNAQSLSHKYSMKGESNGR